MMTLCMCGCGNETSLVKKGDPKRGIVKGSSRKYIRGHNMGKNGNCGRGHKKNSKGRCRKCSSARIRSKKYNIPFEEALEVPENCELCGIHEEDAAWGTMTLDHCHDSGKFRGWICGECNRGLGAFDDDVELLKLAIKYLEDRNALQ